MTQLTRVPFKPETLDWPRTAYRRDLPVAEPPLLDQLQIQPHTTREVPFSAADDHWADTHLELVDKPCLDRLRGEFRTGHSDVARDICLELADPIGIERQLDFCPCAARLGEGPRVNDFLRSLPLPRKVEHELWLIGNRVRGLPVQHRLVHSPSVKTGAE